MPFWPSHAMYLSKNRKKNLKLIDGYDVNINYWIGSAGCAYLMKWISSHYFSSLIYVNPSLLLSNNLRWAPRYLIFTPRGTDFIITKMSYCKHWLKTLGQTQPSKLRGFSLKEKEKILGDSRQFSSRNLGVKLHGYPSTYPEEINWQNEASMTTPPLYNYKLFWLKELHDFIDYHQFKDHFILTLIVTRFFWKKRQKIKKIVQNVRMVHLAPRRFIFFLVNICREKITTEDKLKKKGKKTSWIRVRMVRL